MKFKESETRITVFHGEIISTTEWSHQIPLMFMCKERALNIVKGNECSDEEFLAMKPGEIMVFTKTGYISGIAKDSDKNYRLLKTPTHSE